MRDRALLIGITATLVGVVLFHFYLNRAEEQIAGGAEVRVLMVTRDTEPGEPLSASALSKRTLREKYVDSRHILVKDLDRVVGERTSVAVRAGDALLWTDLATTSHRARTLSSLVREGKRAFTIDTDRASFSGLLRPGDRVDVMSLTPQGEPKLVLENVLVLAVGDDIGEHAAGSQASASRATKVAVSVTPEESALLARAQEQGALRLLLRNPNDIVVSSEGTTRARDEAAGRGSR